MWSYNKNIVKENGCRHESSTPTICRPYYFHINTSDSYDETQGQVQRWVTFTYFSRPIANKGKRFDDKSWFIQFVSL